MPDTPEDNSNTFVHGAKTLGSGLEAFGEATGHVVGSTIQGVRKCLLHIVKDRPNTHE